MIARRALISLAALLLAAQAVRNAAVAGFAANRPETAAKLWAGHPSVEISLALVRIAAASRARQAVDPSVFATMGDAAAKSPLSPEPYLVRGVQAQMAGDRAAAKKAFLAAQWRDPRSRPAAYFLADSYLRDGRALDGLRQMLLLARLSPEASGSVAPFVAAYAQDRSNWRQMHFLFSSQDGLEEEVLNVLARDARNTEAVLALADINHRKPGSPWLRTLLQSLVASGDYARARAIWAMVGGGHPGDGLLYDSGFSAAEPPPPFNWSLASSTVGLAERQPGKRLHVVFYGNDDGALATQLLLLPAGTYRLQMRVVGEPVHPESLRWSLHCDKSPDLFADSDTGQAEHGWTFRVPANCPAQWLELSGHSADVAEQSDLTITGLTLVQVAAGA